MPRLPLLLALLLLAAPACAETLPPGFCDALVKHTPRADVAYQPGIDVNGNPVVPADLDGGGKVELPDEIVLPITADLFKVMNLDQTKFPFQTMARNDIYLGTFTLRGGKVFWNGKPLDDAQQDNLAVLCMQPSP